MCWCLKKQDNPTYSIERVAFRFHRLLPDFVWNASMLEGNPLTFAEVQTLLDGVIVGGQKISDQEQVLESQIEHPFEKAAAFFLFGARR